ncbi:hypothetical protein R69608_07182 [Paraburkholderia nemoris]|uniref:hypothetical protein n=1 Tax=Paraburkholderia nemoris TaxID=2793076 RepID=UPI001912311C|nr:hypothetical protein [Paraburkholderia nemoris]MBK5152590.1 hypothetical protein [Burkholderia sp. R-69608]CAE6969210.1 hypothetical protein R69608_07182 [Paraburkholderia nemoris]
MIHRPALALAVAATGTAVCMSVLAGWQRGGWLSERLVWVAVSVVLIGGAHLLPAICRSTPLAVRGIGVVLWLGCMAAASWGHAMFFLLSQSHAGEVRVSAVPIGSVPAHRALTAVMAERASVAAGLAVADAQHCIHSCPSLRVRRTSLATRLDALDAEAADVRRYQVIEDGNAAHRDSVRDDPVTAQLALLRGVANTKLDLFTGLAFAAVLEGTACLLWWIALLPQDTSPIIDRHERVSAVTADVPVVTPVEVPTIPAMTEPETEVTKLRRDIEAGIVRPTVASIRKHLGCSQSRAAALRKLVIDPAA